MRRAHGQYKHRQSHVLVHKTNTVTQNKDNQDRTLAFIRDLDPTYKTTAIYKHLKVHINVLSSVI